MENLIDFIMGGSVELSGEVYIRFFVFAVICSGIFHLVGEIIKAVRK